MSPAHSSERPALIGAIWAQTGSGIIGEAGTMPWHVPEDLKHFKRVTAGHPVIMGRRTWESFPDKFRPLPGRTNIVLTTNTGSFEQLRAAGAEPAQSLDEALALAARSEGSEEIWIIGGGAVYAQAMEHIDTALVTRLDLQLTGDTTAPQLPDGFEQVLCDPEAGWHTSTSQIRYRFEAWHNRRTSP
ncbi:dihydrofolate reductase [Glutamicibacter sp. MNS18]|uniref:dihydrofolate reductase n=1 Tax=Glutamicibacter sp. MNS18 TaxID=2989817 RepID=UPI0022354E89|nr:dihydrofolate reductase [Glutamicibacter sp. MNS18]MCW4464121.1 dihydrofolate reductase [Glutamicibacter sp. MNS18]